MELEAYLDYLTKFIQETVTKAHCKGVIVGISGGVDSAVAANLAKKAFPNDYLTVWMPINSSQEDLDCTKQLIEQNQLKSVTLDLGPTFDQLVQQIKSTQNELTPLAAANTKARLRMTSLYAYAQTHNYLVLGTDNYDEWHIGYFTKYGDGGVDVAPLIHLLKSEVYAAAKFFQVPASIIDRPPTAGLWEDQTDEKEIGFSYQEIDDFFLQKNQDPALKKRLDELHQQSEHKRQLPVHPEPFKRSN